MTASQKLKLLNAIDEIKREAGTDAALSPAVVLGLLKARFSALWEELKEPPADVQGLQIIATRRGQAIRSRSPRQTTQIKLGYPELGEVTLPVAIRIPPSSKKGEPLKGHRGQWGKTMEVSLADFGLWLARQALRLKNATAKRKANLKAQRSLYLRALSNAKGDKTMMLGAALALRKRKARERRTV